MNHSTAWDLIPWLANGRLSASEREAIEEHLPQCAACRVELAAQQTVMAAMSRDSVIESMPNASFQKLMSRIDATAPSRASIAPRRGLRRPQMVGWLTAAVVFQAVLLGTLGTALYEARNRGAAADFRTVSSAPVQPGAAVVRAVFSPTLTLGELQALLEKAKLRIVAGPSEDGVYSLALASPKDDARRALLTLRSHPAARFAEPVGP
jgi:anti-sigma factor RsiW